MHLPVSIYAHAGHDDGWFLNMARAIISGRWFGDYNHMSLIKGPTYPFFLALNNAFGFPISLPTAVLHICSVGLLYKLLRALGLPGLIAVLISALLLFEPAQFPIRVIRDNIYTPLTLLAFFGFALVCLRPNKRPNKWLIVSTGTAAGLYWLTREEGVWILPGLFILGLYGLYVRRKEASEILYFSRTSMLYIMCATMPIFLIGLGNYVAYGKFAQVSVKTSEFRSALESMSYVHAGREVQYLPVSREKRQLIYAESPAFRELEPFLEDQLKGWMEWGCIVHPKTCGDYAGGWFMWALRDAVYLAGHSSNLASESIFYQRIADEIEIACEAAKLSCTTGLIPYMPSMTKEARQMLIGKILNAVLFTSFHRGIAIHGGFSTDPGNFAADFIGRPESMPGQQARTISLNGWFGPQSNDWIEVRCKSPHKTPVIPIKRQKSPDIVSHFGDPAADQQRFDFTISNFEACNIGVVGQPDAVISLASMQRESPVSYKLGQYSLQLDNVNVPPSPLSNAWFPVKKYLLSLYQIISPILFFSGGVAFLAICIARVFGAGRISDLMVLTSSLWVIYIARILIIVLVDITSFPAINSLYLMPAYSISLLAAALSLVIFGKNVVYMMRGSRPREIASQPGENSTAKEQ